MKHRLLLLVAAVGLVACDELAPPPVPPQPDQYGLTSSDGRQYFSTERRYAPAADEVKAAAASELPPVRPADVVPNMIIRTAAARIEVDSLEPAIAQVRELAERVGGYVANTSIDAGNKQVRSAVLEVKIPAVRFDEGLSGLSPIGELEAMTVDADDVGEEFVDVTARMENSRRLERRLIDLLAQRTGKLKDVLDVEQALARVREEIERYEGRLRYLRAHTAVSTLNVHVHEPLPVVGTAGRSVMGEAFRQAWRNFVTFIAVAVQSLGILIPLGAVALIFWIVSRRWRRVINQPTA